MTTSDPRLMIPIFRTSLPKLIMTDTESIFNQFFLKKEYNKKYWPYQYVITHDSREAERWCWERFKGRYWSSYGGKFAFKREKDAVLFALRWA